MIIRGILIALRHASRYKIYTLINLGGLAIGLSASIIILQYVYEEFSYDRFHRLSENVYRLNTITQSPSGALSQAAATPLLAPTLMTDIPEVEAAVRLRHADDVIVEVGDRKFYENRVFFADSNFFKVLTFPLEKGNSNTALQRINTAVITSEFATKYFGKDDPIDKTLVVNGQLLQITGVSSETRKSHFRFDILVSFETFTPPRGIPLSLESWAWTSFPTYVRLREGVDAKSVEAKFPGFIGRYRSLEDAKKISYQLQHIDDVYLHSRDILERDGISTKGDYRYTMGLLAIASLIFIIACFNFANLSTTLSINRMKEAGVKRTLGSTSKGIFMQFVCESLLQATVGLVLAVIIHLLAVISGLIPNVSLSSTLALHLRWIPVYLVIVFLIGLLAGVYPGIFLASLSARQALKGRSALSRGRRKMSFRKAVIVCQFFVTTVLIAASIVVKKQMDFVQAKPLGYNKDGIIVLHLPDKEMRRHYPTIRTKIMQHEEIVSVSASRDMFDGQQGNTDVVEEGSSEEPQMISMFRMYPNFIETMGIKVVAGRSFTEPLTDSTSFVLNEAAVKMLGWRNSDALARRLHSYGQTGKVIGVVEDFHFASLHTVVAPLIMLIPKTKVEYLYIRIAPHKLNEVLGKIEADWRELVPNLPFNFVVLDEHVGDMYRQEAQFSRLTFFFCMLSVGLACLGLFGITALMTESRVKEIGIRKVLGASTPRITVLLSSEFLLLVVVAGILALPASSYFLEQWLSGFAYRIDVTKDVFIIAISLSTFLAIASVGVKSISAAGTNPVNCLKNE
ncbi:ABC transporter permease [Chryseolinea sp. T2]|uniref:ABC transporter permease n=1 Tax=Chryseolinea sp. T2 TaxID=3129255 RepID=UPI003078737C